MALPEMSAVCTNCSARLRARPKRSFLGFLNFHCFSCRKDFTYPLTSGYRTTYWVFVVLMVATVAATFARGQVGFPSVVALLGAVALVKDAGIRKRVAAASKIAPVRAPAPTA
jgi:transposase-like protein